MKSFLVGRKGILRIIPIPTLLALLVISYCGAYSSDLEHKCIHDTEEMQTLIYGPIVDVKTGQRHGFTPQGILERTAPQQYQPMPPPDAPDEVHRAFHATAIGNIRIVPSTLDLNDTTKYCTKEGDVVPDFKGGTIVCAAEDIFTEEKRDILLNKVLPAAIAMLSGALKVKQVQGNLTSPGCKHYTVPMWHKVTGQANADYVMYVSAAPTVAHTIAWAGTCFLFSSGRPVVGRANFGPKYLVWKDLDSNRQRKLVHAAVHEILHALGFSYSFWGNYFPTGNPIATESRRGKTVRYFSSKKVVKKAREQFDCPTLRGPELENEGGSGTGSSHWERRNHKDDIMAGNGNRWSYLTPITLAVMEDSGHYTIDWSKAENPKWMYKAGCGVFTEKCNTTAGGLGKYFCNDGLEACTVDRRSIGYCDISNFIVDLPSWAQYFPGDPTKGGSEPLMDYCPIVMMFDNRQCDNPANKDTNETVIPSYYANNGRCFKTDGVIQDGFTSSTLVPANCLQTRCVSNAVEFKMPGNDTWIPCPSEGAKVTLLQYGYNGSVICPDPHIICDGVESNAPAPPPKKPDALPPKEPKELPKKALTKTTTEVFIKCRSTKRKSATAISCTVPAVLITSVVFLYLAVYQIGTS